MSPARALAEDGFVVFRVCPETRRWADAATVLADRVLADAAMRARWLDCDGTWFVGVDALPTGPEGQAGDVPLDGPFRAMLPQVVPWHPAQLSAVFPGYPRPRTGESDAAFRYRRDRDAAHVDGLLAVGPDRRRFLREPHAFILGIGLETAGPEAAPLVVWPGSHQFMGDMFRSALAGAAAPDQVDVTAAYVETRRLCFERCPRVPVPLSPGDCVLLHPMLLHGIAPWPMSAPRGGARRMTAYFRPIADGGIAGWLAL